MLPNATTKNLSAAASSISSPRRTPFGEHHDSEPTQQQKGAAQYFPLRGRQSPVPSAAAGNVRRLILR